MDIIHASRIKLVRLVFINSNLSFSRYQTKSNSLGFFILRFIECQKYDYCLTLKKEIYEVSYIIDIW